MYNYRTICICGGGGLGHTIAASLNHNGYQVNLLTGHPEQWSNHIHVTDCNGTIITGEIAKISKYPEEVIPFSDIILLCVPGYLIQKLCMQSPHMLITILRSVQSLAVVVFLDGSS